MDSSTLGMVILQYVKGNIRSEVISQFMRMHIFEKNYFLAAKGPTYINYIE
jgi:hypothetical protein